MFKYLYKTLVCILKSKYKWLLILYVVWIYRVELYGAGDLGVARGIQIFAIFTMLALVLKYKKNVILLTFQHRGMPVKTILWLYMFAIMTTLWAYTPTFAFFLSFQNFVMLFLLVWLFGNFKTFRSAEMAFLTSVILTIFYNAIASRLVYAHGLMTHNLIAGSVAAICFTYCSAELMVERRNDKMRKRILKWCIIASLFVLVTSTSSGANISAVVGFCVALVLSGKAKYAMPLLMVAMLLYLNPEWIESLTYFLMPGKTKEVIESRNGRETIWEGIMAVTAERPLYGWGFACVERVASVYLNWRVSDPHNNYLGFYGGLGIIGIVLFLYHQAVTTWQAFMQRNKLGCFGLFSAFCCVSVNGYSYGYLAGKTCSITVIYFALLILLYVYPKLKIYK